VHSKKGVRQRECLRRAGGNLFLPTCIKGGRSIPSQGSQYNDWRQTTEEKEQICIPEKGEGGQGGNRHFQLENLDVDDPLPEMSSTTTNPAPKKKIKKKTNPSDTGKIDLFWWKKTTKRGTTEKKETLLPKRERDPTKRVEYRRGGNSRAPG